MTRQISFCLDKYQPILTFLVFTIYHLPSKSVLLNVHLLLTGAVEVVFLADELVFVDDEEFFSRRKLLPASGASEAFQVEDFRPGVTDQV